MGKEALTRGIEIHSASTSGFQDLIYWAMVLNRYWLFISLAVSLNIRISGLQPWSLSLASWLGDYDIRSM